VSMKPSPDIIRDFSRLQADCQALGKSNVILAQENVKLRESMQEAWKLVNAMAGQEYWQRAEDWLAANSWAKPSDMV
jgi:hypothetical protein